MDILSDINITGNLKIETNPGISEKYITISKTYDDGTLSEFFYAGQKTRIRTLCSDDAFTSRLSVTSEFYYLADGSTPYSVWNKNYIFGKAFNVLIPASCTSFKIFGFEIDKGPSSSTMTDNNKCMFMVYPNITAFVDNKRVEMDYEINTSDVFNGVVFSELIIGNISPCSSPRNAVFSIQPSWL